MTLAYSFDKAKLPRGLSFPLRRSALDTVLLEAGVTGIHCVYHWVRQGGEVLLRADFCGEGRRGWAAAGLTSITVYAVPSGERKQAESCLVSEVLPRMAFWLKDLEQAGNTRRGVDQSFVATCEAETLVIEAS